MAANNKEQADFIKFLSTTLLPNEESATDDAPEQQYPPNATGQRHQNGNETQNSNVNIQGQFQGYLPQQNTDVSYRNPTNAVNHQQNDMSQMYRMPNDGGMFQDPRYRDPSFMNVHDPYQHVSPQEEAKFVQNFAVSGAPPPQFMGYNWNFQHPFGGLPPPQDSRLFNPQNGMGMGGMFTPQGAMPPYGRQQDFGRPVFANYAPPMPGQDDRAHQMYAPGVPGLQQMAPMQPNMQMKMPIGQPQNGQTQPSSQAPAPTQKNNGSAQQKVASQPPKRTNVAPTATRDVQTKAPLPKQKNVGAAQKPRTQQRAATSKPEALHFGVANMSIQDSNQKDVQKPKAQPPRNTQTATRPSNAKRNTTNQQKPKPQPAAKPAAARSWASIARKNPGKGPMHQPPRNPMLKQMPAKKKRPLAAPQARDTTKRYNSNNTTAPQSNGSYENSTLPKELLQSVNSSSFDHRPKYARFFVIKSYSEDDVHKCIKYSIWASTDSGNRRLDTAFRESASKGPIYLFFSVNASGQFCGMAEMKSPVDYAKKCSLWTQDKWNGQFTVEWKFIKDIPNSQFRHIRLPNNDNKPVTNSRDTQEVLLDPGREILKTFKQYNSKTSILDDFAWYDRRQEFMIGKKKEQQNSEANGHSDYHSYTKKNNSYGNSKGSGNHIKTNPQKGGLVNNSRRIRKM